MLVTPLRPFLFKLFLPLCLLFVAAGCKTYSEDDKQSFDATIGQYAKRHHWKAVRSESGLYSEQLHEGTGDEAIMARSEVTLKYKGKLLNGFVFDQTPPNKPLTAELKGLIGGFQEGLLGQKKGAKLRLLVPPQLGYGDDELDKIPANSVLIFELEVLDVH